MSVEVSVIIPTYNRSHVIFDAIDSVIAQTYRVHEIVVVDDGSTDNTRELIRDKGREYPIIKYIEQQNAGSAAARNNGVRNAGGDLIAFLDSDDVWHPQKMAFQIKCLIRLDVSSCAVKHELFRGGAGDIDYQTYPTESDETFSQLTMEEFLTFKKSMQTSGIVFKKALFPGGQAFDESLRHSGEDHKFIYELLNRGSIGYVDKILFYMRRSPDCPGFAVGSKSASEKAKMYDDFIRAHADGYFRLGRRNGIEARKIRELIGYHLLRRAEIACAQGDFRTARRIALDAGYFSVNLKRKLNGFGLFMMPRLFKSYYTKKWDTEGGGS